MQGEASRRMSPSLCVPPTPVAVLAHPLPGAHWGLPCTEGRPHLRVPKRAAPAAACLRPGYSRKGAQAHATAPHAATRGFPHGAATRLEAAPPVPLQDFGEGCLMLILFFGFGVFFLFTFFRGKRLI